MSTLRITDDGVIFVNGTRIDALVQSQELSGAVLMEREATEGTSGKTASFTGFDDTKISLSLRMTTGNKYTALGMLTQAFKKLENGVPIIYALDFRLAKAMNIATAILSDVRVSKGSGRQDVGATLTLRETDPPVQNIQQQQKQEKEGNEQDTPIAPVAEEPGKIEALILEKRDITRFTAAEGLL